MKKQSHDNFFPILDEGTVKELDRKVKNIGKPSIFIGSSQEALDVAKKVQASFPANKFQVDIWSDGIFGKTKSAGGTMANMEWLKNFTDIYDFAIFIFVPDDHTKSLTRFDMDGNNAREVIAVRHNVVFEFGMFLGRIGAKKSFILFDRDVEHFIDLFFTDLKESLDDEKTMIEINEDFRIEIQGYEGNYANYLGDKKRCLPYNEESINEALQKIIRRIVKNFKEIEINFLPATTLAFGYFNNFINIFITNLEILKGNDDYPEEWTKLDNKYDLDKLRKVIHGTKKIKLKIVIPTSIEGAQQKNFVPDFNRKRFKQISFPGHNRDITLLSKKKLEEQDEDELIIYDLPTTLNSSIEAIEMITRHKDIQELLKEKEIRNFRKSLQFKCEKAARKNKNSNIREHLEFITYHQFKKEME